MPLPFPFDFKNPDYISVLEWRVERLSRIRKNPEVLPALKQFYKNNPAQFITDWGLTFDPRNIEVGRPSLVPFILFEKQEAWVQWLLERWRNQEPGITEKSRTVGLSWLSIALSVTLCLFYDGLVIGFGSRKEEYVDSGGGDKKSLFFKARNFTKHLPKEFTNGWSESRDSSHMVINYPYTDSQLIGEAGDNIGRGNRTSIEFLDEAAWLMRPDVVYAAVSETSNCVQSISTPNGMANAFARKRFGGNIQIFTFHWRDDPRRDQEWYEKKKRDLDDPTLIAQELDLDYSASVDRVLIESEWVEAAIDAHIKLGIEVKGESRLGLDVADEGRDVNALAGRHGILLNYLRSLSGKGSDIYQTVEKTVDVCEECGFYVVKYDADGLGAGVRGDARAINEKRGLEIEFLPFRGSGEVVDPDDEVYPRAKNDPRDNAPGRLNKDFFLNFKSQSGWDLRRRFYLTYRAVVEKAAFDPDKLISISSKLPELGKLKAELTQPRYSKNNAGKIIIDKMPDGAKSPNLADAVMIVYSREKKIYKRFFS